MCHKWKTFLIGDVSITLLIVDVQYKGLQLKGEKGYFGLWLSPTLLSVGGIWRKKAAHIIMARKQGKKGGARGGEVPSRSHPQGLPSHQTSSPTSQSVRNPIIHSPSKSPASECMKLRRDIPNSNSSR